MKLRELEAHFIKVISEPNKPTIYRTVDNLIDADGIDFLCPKCFAANGNSNVGTHHVICWFVGKVADDLSPGPGRWTPEGTSLDDVTFIPSAGRSHSVLLLGDEGCKWHGYVSNGSAE